MAEIDTQTAQAQAPLADKIPTPAAAAAARTADAQAHEPSVSDQDDWAVLGDHSQHPPGHSALAATTILPSPFGQGQDEALFPAAKIESAKAVAPGNAKTMILPAPEFPPQLRAPLDIAGSIAAKTPEAEHADPNARTMILPPPDFKPAEPAPKATEPAAVPATVVIAPAIQIPSKPVVAAAESVLASPGESRADAARLAPPPDHPFGPSSESSSIEFTLPDSARSSRAPAPSGNAWRTVMNEIPTEQPKPVLVATGLIKWFGKRQVVRGVDLEVGAGEIIGLLGRNGAGKTTTFRMIMGLLHPDGGHVTYEGRDVTRLPMYARANRGIGYLAQNPSVFQRLNVEENLMAVLELQEPSRSVRKDRMEELIKSLGLEKVRLQQAAVLSGGERRRLEIARAMSLRPRIVLFDEPFAGIDPITVNEIQSILKDLKKQGVGVLITDHNVRETLTITDRTYIMDDGQIWIHGHPKEIVKNEEARSRYLGHEFRLDF